MIKKESREVSMERKQVRGTCIPIQISSLRRQVDPVTMRMRLNHTTYSFPTANGGKRESNRILGTTSEGTCWIALHPCF